MYFYFKYPDFTELTSLSWNKSSEGRELEFSGSYPQVSSRKTFFESTKHSKEVQLWHLLSLFVVGIFKQKPEELCNHLIFFVWMACLSSTDLSVAAWKNTTLLSSELSVLRINYLLNLLLFQRL